MTRDSLSIVVSIGTILAFAVLAVGVLGFASIASADVHGSCTDFAGESAEPAINPSGYANVFLMNRPGDEGLTITAVVNCPGARIHNASVSINEAETGEEAGHLEWAECEPTTTSPCEFNDTVNLEAGSYWLDFTFDSDTSKEWGMDYDDVERSQRYEWSGVGQPVVTCPDLGWIHLNPPCP